jgi:3-deoxy-D-manno-octulosonate 8-phosphate phosphatase (KDO 8-P phosphatase)
MNEPLIFSLNKQIIPEQAKSIRGIIFDVDGVLTDGRLYLGDDGQEYKSFHALDGHGLRLLLEQGFRLGIITGRSSQVVAHRMKDLGITDVYQGYRKKLPAFEALCHTWQLPTTQLAFVGDDVVDLPVMTRVGLAISVANAHPLVKAYSHWQTAHSGGAGAVREIAEGLLFAQDKLLTVWQGYLS